MNLEPKNRRILGFNVIALSDVIFILLIFFLLSSSFVLMNGLPVDVPLAGQSGVRPGVVITLSSDKEIFINQKQVSEQTFQSELRSFLKASPEKKVVFRADRRIEFGFFIRMLELSRASGARILGIYTKPAE